MNKADLAEIRAQLQASIAPERGRKPLLGPLRGLFPAASAEPQRKLSYPAPRRVGLRTAEPADVEAVEALLDDPSEAEAARRRAFGQRQEPTPQALPVLLLAAPPIDPPAEDEALAELKRRRASRLDASPPGETPYHPEDLSDAVEAHAEALYAESGLFEPPAPEAPAPTLASAQEPATEPGPDQGPDQGRAALERLETMFLAEQTALTRRSA